MLLICVLMFFVRFIEADDFDEITYRKYPAMNYSKIQLEKIVRIAKEGGWTYDRAMFVHCKGIDYLSNFTFLAKYNYLNNSRIVNADLAIQQTDGSMIMRFYTATLYVEVQGSNFLLSFQFWLFMEPYDTPNERWELSRVEDLKCDLPKKPHIQEAIEMVQYFYFTGGKWGKDMLPKMFVKDALLFKFCDGNYEKYFFDQNDGFSNDSVILHRVVRFSRSIDRQYILYFILPYNKNVDEEIVYYQVDVTVNGRRMQLEYDDDWKMFTKGREYPCYEDNNESSGIKV